MIPNAPSEATKIDYAFFLDLGEHASISKERITGAKAAIEAEKTKIGRPLSPTERRRVIGQYFAGQVNLFPLTNVVLAIVGECS